MYHYCILPGGNKNEFPELDAELCRRGVDAYYWPLRAGGRIYRIPDSQLPKLPCDTDAEGRPPAPYLGDDNSGHSIYPLSERALYTFGEPRWKKVWVIK